MSVFLPRLYRGDIAISALDYTATRTLASQAADELLNISAGFFLYFQWFAGDQM